MQYIGYRNIFVDQNSVVGIVTRYGLEGPGIQFRWGRNFPYPSRPALRFCQPPVKWVSDVIALGKAAGVWRWPRPLI
jgi:hypothetical protein